MYLYLFSINLIFLIWYYDVVNIDKILCIWYKLNLIFVLNIIFLLVFFNWDFLKWFMFVEFLSVRLIWMLIFERLLLENLISLNKIDMNFFRIFLFIRFWDIGFILCSMRIIYFFFEIIIWILNFFCRILLIFSNCFLDNDWRICFFIWVMYSLDVDVVFKWRIILIRLFLVFVFFDFFWFCKWLKIFMFIMYLLFWLICMLMFLLYDIIWIFVLLFCNFWFIDFLNDFLKVKNDEILFFKNLRVCKFFL